MNKTISETQSTCHQCGRGLGPGDQVTIYSDGRHYGQRIHRRGKVGWCHESITGSTNHVLPMADWREEDYNPVVETEGESVDTSASPKQSTIPQSVEKDIDEIYTMMEHLVTRVKDLEDTVEQFQEQVKDQVVLCQRMIRGEIK